MSIEIKKSQKPVKYEDALKFMEKRLQEIDQNKSNDLIWILEHDDIYTAGTTFKENEVLDKSIKILKTNRGGKITYHGPGQLICYFVIDLKKGKKDIRKFISIIEDSLITLLANYNVEARSFKDRVGIWVTNSNKIKFNKEKKIGAIGLRVTKWVTYHGLSFNINPDLNYYNNIHSCGLKDYKNTSLKEIGINISNEEFDEKYKNIFFQKISYL